MDHIIVPTKIHCQAKSKKSTADLVAKWHDDDKIQNSCKEQKTVLYEKPFLLGNSSEDIPQFVIDRNPDPNCFGYFPNVTKLLLQHGCKVNEVNEVTEYRSEPVEETKDKTRSQKNASTHNSKKPRVEGPVSVDDTKALLMPASVPKVLDLMDPAIVCSSEKVQIVMDDRNNLSISLAKVMKDIKQEKKEESQVRATFESHNKAVRKQFKSFKFSEDLYTQFQLALESMYKECNLHNDYHSRCISNQEPLEEPYQAYNRLLCALVSIIDSDNAISKDRNTWLTKLFLEVPLITEDAIEALKIISFQDSRGSALLQLLRDLAINRPNKKLQSHILNVLLCHVTHKSVAVQAQAMRILDSPKIAQLFIRHSVINLYNSQPPFSMRSFIRCILVCTDDDRFLKTKLSEEISECIDQYLLTVFSQAEKVSPENLVDFYVNKFETFQMNSSLLNKACYWLYSSIPKVYKKKLYDIKSVYQLAMVSWRYHILKHFNVQITKTFLSLVEQERKGEIINAKLMSSIVHSYVELGKVKETNQLTNEVIYKNFESQFLKDTVKFYGRKSSMFLHYNTITDYMKEIELWLLQEEKHAQNYFDQSTCEHLSNICKRVLIEKHLHSFYTEFETLLNTDKKADLARMYTLIAKVDNGLNETRNLFENYIANQGLAAIDECKDVVSRDPKSYFNTILNIYQKYKELVLVSFQNDVGFVSSLDRACCRFINTNSVTKTVSNTARSSELLAKYCDQLLKKSCNLQETILEDTLSQAVLLFKYIEDKDVFQEFYIKMLAKRLLYQVSVSEDAEAFMISKLKQACGFGYTSKLQKMLQDVSLSRDLNDAFKKNVVNSFEPVGLDFNVQVLSFGSWPLQQFSTLALPKELEQLTAKFTTFYSSQHSGRKLCWLHQLGRGEIITSCFKRKYIFQASTVQIAVLLQYNLVTCWTLEQLHESTQIEMKVLRQVVKVLLKAKLLVVKGSELGPSTPLNLFMDYKNKKLKVNINLSIEAEAQTEQETVHKHIEKERKLLTEAAIVKVMKMRKRLKYEQLVVEILNELNSKFQPKVPMIKNCIDILIDKEYLKRADGQKDVYDYLA